MFATAAQGAREPAARTLAVSKAQGVSNGLCEGEFSPAYSEPPPAHEHS